MIYLNKQVFEKNLYFFRIFLFFAIYMNFDLLLNELEI